ncbi:MAG: hypothetical protein AAF495_11805 [Pseudomonadota bacterium]
MSAIKRQTSEQDGIFKEYWWERVWAKKPWGGVSPIHLQEARERYISLFRMVHHYAEEHDCRAVIKQIEAERPSAGFTALFKFMDYLPFARREDATRSDNQEPEERPAREAAGQLDSKEEERCKICLKLETCYKILTNIRWNYLSTQEDHLSFAWRELTRVRLILTDHVLKGADLAGQVDSCREEAYRLALSKDTEIADMIQRLAETMDSSGSNDNQVKRQLKALLERFNSIRTSRMRRQFLNIRAYTWAVIVLFILSFILIANERQILCVGDYASSPHCMKLIEGQPPAEAADATGADDQTGTIAGWLGGWWDWLHNVLNSHVLAFVYLGGLTGGFFSVAIKVRRRASVPGEDAYVMRYTLTKPLLGALGAVILFILFHAGFVQSDLVKDIGLSPSAKVFAFAFISGFTERMVFPDFNK